MSKVNKFPSEIRNFVTEKPRDSAMDLFTKALKEFCMIPKSLWQQA